MQVGKEKPSESKASSIPFDIGNEEVAMLPKGHGQKIETSMSPRSFY